MKMKRAFSRIFVGLLALLVATLPAASTYAIIDFSTLKFYAENNIMYYDPTPAQTCSSALDCNIAGETRDEKLWSGLRNLGLTPVQTAALMGNILNEGGTPVRQEEAYNIARDNNCLTSNKTPYDIWSDETNGQKHAQCMADITKGKYYNVGTGVAGIGLGFVQWTSHGRRLGYLKLMQDAGLLKYFDGDAYKVYGRLTDDQLKKKIVEETGSEADYWALWCTALKYIYQELQQNHKKFFNFTSVEEAAGYISSDYEVCSTCGVNGKEYNERVEDAKTIYKRYESGEFSAVEGGMAIRHNYGSNTLSNGSTVTIIGDETVVASQSKILNLLPQAEIIANASKQFASGTNNGQEIVSGKHDLRSTVIISLGANGASVTTNQVDNMVAAIGESHNIIFIDNYDGLSPSKYQSNNQQFAAAATKYSNVSVVEWSTAVRSAQAANTSTAYLIEEDGQAITPTAAGAEIFAETIKQALSKIAGAVSTCVTDRITDPQQAVAYLNQFIIDTNNKYGKNYQLPPANPPINEPLGTPLDDSSTGASDGCWHGTYCGQCTALSGWFIDMMTEYKSGGGNGGQVVANLQSVNGGSILSAALGQWPSGIAIFSNSSGSSDPYGHTGVILGRDSENNFITIENNINVHQLSIRISSEERFINTNATFYPIQHVKLEHLGTR